MSAAADRVEAIARAVLYEGYLLWPYRRSARKNQSRFTFGTLYPPGFCADARQGDASTLRCECLVEGNGDASITVELRCLHLVHRQVLAGAAGESCERVDRVEIDGRPHLTWDEARERRHPLASVPLGQLASAAARSVFRAEAGVEEESLGIGDDGRPAVLERSWEPLEALVEVGTSRVPDAELPLWRLTVDVANRRPWTGSDRLAAQRQSLLSAHLMLRVAGAAGFVSMADPPPLAAAAAAACRSVGVWPVLVGEPQAGSPPAGESRAGRTSDVVLASPIVLEDHPRTAPESPGDLFDGAEIVELLGLSILALTDAEKQEMAATDPAALAILERTEALGREGLERLHGALRPVAGGGS